MKLVIFAVVAFVVGAGGGTGVRVMTAPALPPGADSLLAAADSSKAHALPHATDHGGSAAHSAPAGAEAGHGDPHATTAKAGDAGVPVAPIAVAENDGGAASTAKASVQSQVQVVSAEPDPEAYKQVGNILLAMKPVEAARIIAYLSDEQVHGLLRAMGPRQAAQVLAQLPPERGAVLSRRLLAQSREAH